MTTLEGITVERIREDAVYNYYRISGNGIESDDEEPFIYEKYLKSGQYSEQDIACEYIN